MEVMISLSALKPSMYRKYVKGWDKGRYAELFTKHSNDRNAFRIYIPLDTQDVSTIRAPAIVEEHLKRAGYVVEDYRAGIAVTENGKRRMRIGRLLKDPDVKRMFDNDEQRKAYKGSHIICISRHPYDIVGASTDRGWTSCMNLKDGEKRQYMKEDVKHGSLIAYLIESHDKNINRPVGRVLIKPFLKDGHTVLACEESVYGATVSNFIPTVQRWLNKNFNHSAPDGAYRMHKSLYVDDSAEFNFYNEGSQGFWKEVNNVTFIKSRLSKKGYRVHTTPQREHALRNVPDVLDKLEIVTVDDLAVVLGDHPKTVIAWLDKNLKKLVVRGTEDKQFVTYTPVQKVEVIDRLLKFNTRSIADVFESNVFKLTDKELAELLPKRSFYAKNLDWGRMPIEKVLRVFSAVKRLGETPSDYDGVWNKLEPAVYMPVLDKILKLDRGIVAYLKEIPTDVVKKDADRILESAVNNGNLGNMDEKTIRLLAENADPKRSAYNNLISIIVGGGSRFNKYSELMDLLDSRSRRRDWIDYHSSDYPSVERLTDEQLIRFGAKNISIVDSLIEFNHIDKALMLAEKDPQVAVTIINTGGFSNYYWKNKGKEIVELCRKALAVDPKCVTPGNIQAIAKHGWRFAMEVVDLCYAQNNTLFNVPEKVGTAVWWTRISIRKLINDIPYAKNHFLVNYPWALKALLVAQSTPKQFNREVKPSFLEKIAKMEPKGTPAQKRTCNELKKIAQAALGS